MQQIYVKSVTLPDYETEQTKLWYNIKTKMSAYSSCYPFRILNEKVMKPLTLDFEPITLLYGNNGSGKTTLLNVIAQLAKVNRTSPYNRTNYFEDYVSLCKYDLSEDAKYMSVCDSKFNSWIITSDDVFQKVLSVRETNDYILHRQNELIEERAYEIAHPIKSVDFDNEESIRAFKTNNMARRVNCSQFIKENVGKDIITHSNGETAYNYFIKKIEPYGLYLLDEPENSLSAKLQMELSRYIETMARHERCQFIIATHSPFFLAMSPSKVYNVDERPICVSRWTDLENIRSYRDLFKTHESEFDIL